MAVQKRRLDWTAIKNALRINSVSMRRVRIAGLPAEFLKHHGEHCHEVVVEKFASVATWTVIPQHHTDFTLVTGIAAFARKTRGH